MFDGEYNVDKLIMILIMAPFLTVSFICLRNALSIVSRSLNNIVLLLKVELVVIGLIVFQI